GTCPILIFIKKVLNTINNYYLDQLVFGAPLDNKVLDFDPCRVVVLLCFLIFF
ncbi:unnamed protein product, partial [Arabidopsis halleri]